MNQYKNIAKAKAIEQKNRERLLKVNPKLNDKLFDFMDERSYEK